MRMAIGWALLAMSGCAAEAGWPDVVAGGDLASGGGAPRISAVRDLGLGHLPPSKALAGSARPDGVAAIGELILIEGHGFGRLPTVLIGGRGAEVVARTRGGGVVARVPRAVGTGPQEVELVVPDGRARGRIAVRRYALALVGGDDTLRSLEVDPGGARPLGRPLVIPGARLVRLSGDGAYAYVVAAPQGAAPRLWIVDLTAPAGPALAGSQPLPQGTPRALASAERAPRLAVVLDARAVLFDVGSPLEPAAYPPIALGGEADELAIAGAELDPTGAHLALLDGGHDRVLLLGVADPAAPRPAERVDLFPQSRVPLTRDLGLAGDGVTLWIVSGDSPESAAAGRQPTRLTALRLDVARPAGVPMAADAPGAPRTVDVPGAGAPLAIAVARGLALASGTVLRLATGPDALLVSAADGTLGPDPVAGARRVERPGVVMRADGRGGGAKVLDAPELLGALAVTPDGALLLAAAARGAEGAGGAVAYGLIVGSVGGAAASTFLPLGDAPLDRVARGPRGFGAVRIQP